MSFEIDDIKLAKSSEGNKSKSAVKDAEKRKKASQETLEDAWERIFNMKNTSADLTKLKTVKHAMDSGMVEREKGSEGKRFSKAEALRLFQNVMAIERKEKLEKLVNETPHNYFLVISNDSIKKLKADIQTADLIAFDLETFGEKGTDDSLDPWRGKIAGFSVSANDNHYYVPLNHVEKEVDDKAVVNYLKTSLISARSVMHNAPFDCKWFYLHYGVDMVTNLYADTRIMAHLANENVSHRLKDLVTLWLKEDSDNFDELFGSTPFNEIPLDVALVYGAGDTDKTMKLYRFLERTFSGPKFERIRELFKIEMAVCRQFIRSDLHGIGFSPEEAEKLDKQYEEEAGELAEEIYELAGEEFNIDSTKQLSEILFVKLKLPDFKDGSTSKKALEKITGAHPIVNKVLEYRGVNKLRSSFTKSLPGKVQYDGLIHPRHNSCGAVTGRFTCKTPNTQQMPSKRPEIRYLFKPTSEDRMFIAIDYSQIELRVLAHLANEEALIDAFKTGKDIHSLTASKISDFTYEEIEADKDTEGHPCQKARKNAKPVNFGIVYGLTKMGLSEQLSVSEKEAQEIIDAFFLNYPGISNYMDTQKETARKQGFVEDMFGRKRRLRSMYNDKRRWLANSADRMAGNFPIQASAGGILKKAIVDLQDVLPELDAAIVLQIHDELLFEVPKDITREGVDKIRKTMEDAVTLKVPVRCDVDICPDYWQQNISVEEWFSS